MDKSPFFIYYVLTLERCLSGRKCRSRKAVGQRWSRGFDSHPLRRYKKFHKQVEFFCLAIYGIIKLLNHLYKSYG